MLVNIIIDVILVAIVIIGAIVGYKRGFFITVTGPVKWFAALLLSFLLCDFVASEFILPLIEGPLTGQLTDYLTEKCAHITGENITEELPTLLKLAAGAAGIDISLIEGTDSASVIAEIVNKLASPAIELFAIIIAFVLLYILLKLFLGIILKILNYFFKHGPLGVLNSALGLVFCAAFSFVISWLLVVIFGYVIHLDAISQYSWVNEFSGGYVYKFLDSITPLDLLLSF